MTAWYIFSGNGTTSNPYDLKLSYIPAGMEREDDQGQATTLGKVLRMSLAMATAPARRTAIWSMVVLFSAKRLISKPLCLVRWVRVDAVRMR